jgi:hypothetical protein
VSARPAVDRAARAAMNKAELRLPVYVVYPAALFDGWEVVVEQDAATDDDVEPASFDTRDDATAYAEDLARSSGGGIVKLENWFGDTEGAWEVPARAARSVASAAS